MSKNIKIYQEIIKYLKQADQNIWEAVMVIDNSNDNELKINIEPLMALRGEILAEFLFKFYKKFPELEPIYEVEESTISEMDEMIDNLFKKEKD